MALVIVITGARLWLRVFRRDLKVGYDDWAIVPALLATVAYMAVAVAMVVYGGAGKHLYDLTYREANWFYQVCFVFLFPFSLSFFWRREWF